MIPISIVEVLDEFLRQITAYDETASIIDYKRRDPIVSPDYVFPGVLIPPTDNDLQLFDEGDIKQGAIVIYSRGTELFYTDIQSPTASQKQTYVRFEGSVYRIKSGSPRMSDGLYRKYGAVRYIKRST